MFCCPVSAVTITNAVSNQVAVSYIYVIGLGLTVTEINIKKVQKQENKNIKGVGIACQIVCKQGRDDLQLHFIV